MVDLHGIYDYVAIQKGLDLRALPQSDVIRKVQARCQALGIAGPKEYLRYLHMQRDELNRFVRDLAVHESWFFRDSGALDYVRQQLQSGRVTSILSAGCARGQEPYSLAVIAAQERVPSARLLLEAVDLNPEIVAEAREGVYDLRLIAHPARETLKAYLHPVDSQHVQLDSQIRDRVHFEVLDLLGERPLASGQYDLILCRNLLIYLTEHGRDQLLSNLAAALKPEGRLIVAPAEQAILMKRGWHAIDYPHSCAFLPGTL